MLKDRIFAFLSNFLGSECNTAEDFNQAMTTLDSLDQMDLIFKIEEEFNIKLGDKIEIKDFNDLLKYIEQKISVSCTN